MGERLQSGATLTGMQCFSASPVMVEAMGAGGLDFTIIDMEHCPTQLETVAHLLRAADASGIVPLVRVPDLDVPLIGRTLDLGAQGIVLPHATMARCVAGVRAVRYAPEGDRGACPVVRAAGYLPEDWQAHSDRSNKEMMLIPLVEDERAVNEIEDIFEIDGIDVVFLGPFDLSISMGLKGADYKHPKLAAILDRVVAAAKKNKKHVMTTVGATLDEKYAATLVNKGVRLLSFSADVAVFLTACRGIAALRG
ncbi:MAG: aldolase/citrate lyase family protein [Usitatibacter sp.]